MQVAIGILIGLVAGGLGGAIAVGALGKSRLGAAQQQRKQLIEDAEREADTLRREAQITAREEAVQLRAEDRPGGRRAPARGSSRSRSACSRRKRRSTGS